jgi:hypothetical protein
LVISGDDENSVKKESERNEDVKFLIITADNTNIPQFEKMKEQGFLTLIK